MMKTCSKCAERKPLDEFYNSKSNRDGKYGSCKKCHCARTRERYKERYANDPEFRQSRLDYARERYANDPEFREYHRDYARRYYHKARKAQTA